VNQSEQQKTIAELETQIERLKSLYSQYFMGIEKIPPNILRKNVDRTVWRLRKIRFKNTAIRFKFQQLIQRYNSYMQHWNRILREIERGTYKRHLQKAAARIGTEAAVAAAGNRQLATLANIAHEEKPAAKVWDITNDGLDDTPTPPRGMPPPAPSSGRPTRQPAHRSAAEADGHGPPPSSSSRPNPWAARAAHRSEASPDSGPPASVRRPPPPPIGPPGSRPKPPLPAPRRPTAPARDTERRQLYQKYIQARQQAGESTRGVTYERLSKSLERETEKLRKKHGSNRDIDFDVAIKNGRAIIRPVVK
jgi:hypothetical protein